MTARCKSCNKRHGFRNTRGAKLSERRCECGGSLELIGGMQSISGKNPFEPNKTYSGSYLVGEYYYAETNRKGEFFYSHPDGYYRPLMNVTLAKRATEE